jgi:arginine-tRNA-protein transferase
MAVRLERGDRRQGVFLYRPNCAACRACEPIRIDVDAFRPSRTQRRVFRQGESALETRMTRPKASTEKVELYNRHKIDRDLVTTDGLIDVEEYGQFLVESCTDTIELDYYHEGTLVGVAVSDRANGSLSAVYCFYDPAYGALSIGTYSILKHIALCRDRGLRYLYLGLYISGCRAMEYKMRFLPHERLVDGEWRSSDGSTLYENSKLAAGNQKQGF